MNRDVYALCIRAMDRWRKKLDKDSPVRVDQADFMEGFRAGFAARGRYKGPARQVKPAKPAIAVCACPECGHVGEPQTGGLTHVCTNLCCTTYRFGPLA